MRKLSVFFGLILLSLGFGAFFARNALNNAHKQEQLTQSDRAKMDQLETQRTTLLRQEVDLESGAGREAKARGLGYKRPNENQISLLPTGTNPPANQGNQPAGQ